MKYSRILLTFLLVMAFMSIASTALASTGAWRPAPSTYGGPRYRYTSQAAGEEQISANLDFDKHALTSGYTGTSYRCVSCHAVHEAGSASASSSGAAYKLLRTMSGTDAATGLVGGQSVFGACLFCHGSSGIVSGKLVFNIPNPEAMHRLSQSADQQIPDSSNDKAGWRNLASKGNGGLDCLDCHRAAPHGGNGVAGTKLFNVTAASGVDLGMPTNDLTPLCRNCHDRNFFLTVNTSSVVTTYRGSTISIGSDGVAIASSESNITASVAARWDGRSHPLVTSSNGMQRNVDGIANRNQAVVNPDGSTTSYRCNRCHDAANTKDNVNTDKVHTSKNTRFLLTSAVPGAAQVRPTAATLDGVCMTCHRWSTVSGVGLTF